MLARIRDIPVSTDGIIRALDVGSGDGYTLTDTTDYEFTDTTDYTLEDTGA